MKSIETKFQVVSLGDVLQYFSKGFGVGVGQRIVHTEPYVDTAKNVVVFKLTVENQ